MGWLLPCGAKETPNICEDEKEDTEQISSEMRFRTKHTLLVLHSRKWCFDFFFSPEVFHWRCWPDCCHWDRMYWILSSQMSWLLPAWHRAVVWPQMAAQHHHPLTHSPLMGWEREWEGGKWEKLASEIKTVRESKTTCTSKAKQAICSPPAVAGTPSTAELGYPLGRWGSAVLALSPPSSPWTPSPLTGGVGETDKALAPSNNYNSWMINCSWHKPKMPPHISHCEENKLPQAKQHSQNVLDIQISCMKMQNCPQRWHSSSTPYSFTYYTGASAPD